MYRRQLDLFQFLDQFLIQEASAVLTKGFKVCVGVSLQSTGMSLQSVGLSLHNVGVSLHSVGECPYRVW